MTSVLIGIVFSIVVAALVFYAARILLATRRREQVRFSSARTSPKPSWRGPRSARV